MSFLSKGTPESQEWAEEAKRDVEAAAPDYVVFALNPYSWNTQDPGFYKWAFSYTKMNYEPVGYADVVSPSKAKYVWGMSSYCRDILKFAIASFHFSCFIRLAAIRRW